MTEKKKKPKEQPKQSPKQNENPPRFFGGWGGVGVGVGIADSQGFS